MNNYTYLFIEKKDFLKKIILEKETGYFIFENEIENTRFSYHQQGESENEDDSIEACKRIKKWFSKNHPELII
jgi:hypothetical protein